MSQIDVSVEDVKARRSAGSVDAERYLALLSEAEELAGFGLWRWEIATGTVQWSRNLERIYRVEPGSFPGTLEAAMSFLQPDDRDNVERGIEYTLRTGEPFLRRQRLVAADGEEIVLLSLGKAVLDENGELVEIVGVSHDITGRVHAEAALGETQARLLAIIEHSPSLIVVKDLDHRYVMTNAETAKLLGVKSEDLIGREFTEHFPTIAERMRHNDDLAVRDGGPVIDDVDLDVAGERRTYRTVTFTLPDATGRPAEVCTIASDVTERRAAETVSSERRRWTEMIEHAIDEGRMRVFGQPVVSLGTGDASPRELLVRMMDERGRLLLPARFLPQAERHGLIATIDLWMVRHAVDLARHGQVSVNLSPLTVSDQEARTEILEMIREGNLEPDRLIFELTETAAPDDLRTACLFARQANELGARFALDDFGTGFGSFTYLRQMPLRFLKIDASFVRYSADSAADRAVVRSIVDIAHQFGLRTVAEGVEDEFTLALMRQAGVHNAQGFLLGEARELTTVE